MISRIKQLLEWQQLSPTQFADRIGIGRPVISHILSERNKPSLDVVQRILAAFPELSTVWLLNGTGDMLLASPTAAPAPAPASTPPVAAPLPPTPAPTAAPSVAAVVLPTAPVEPVVPPVAVPSATAWATPAEPARPVPVAAPRPRIARFSIQKPTEPQPAAEAPSPPVPNEPQLTAAPATPPAPVAEAQPAAPVDSQPAISAGAPSLADMLGEPGKAIRRIVIFYRDGSFADYQPEGC